MQLTTRTVGRTIPILASAAAIGLAILIAPAVSASPAAVASPAPSGPEVGGCPVFPSDNVWNATVDALPLDPNSAAYISTIGTGKSAHADFGSGLWNGGPIGIPFTVVDGSQPKLPVSFEYRDESDAGPYPIPANPPIEGGPNSDGDRHVLIVEKDSCTLYELYAAYPLARSDWKAGSGAIYDLKANGMRPATWTSADAAGLPILPGLVRYDEVASGEIRHAVRFTAPQTRREFIWPARHFASRLTGSQYPPMGQRFRLKASFDISGYAPEVQVILKALKKYGMILADNGASWYLSGAPDERWNNDNLHQLGRLKGSDFEAVDESSLMVNPNSAQSRIAGTPPALAVPTPATLPTPVPTAAAANQQPETGVYDFRLGFKALADQIPEIAGTPLENEHWGANGDSLQRTSMGLMVWRNADNWTAFTNGSRTWINGPEGVQDRGNDERFDWEAAQPAP